MPTYAQTYPHQMSGGEQQRELRLLVHWRRGRAILLLDEPFSNMDVELREQLAREIRKHF